MTFLAEMWSKYWPIGAPAPSQAQSGARPPSPPCDGEAAGRSEKTVDGAVVHRVGASDSLISLSLRYRVPEVRIRFANDIPSSGNLAYLVGKDISIPQGGPEPAPAVSEDGARRALVLAFCAAAGLTGPEARYYLGECEWDLKRAQAMLRVDEEKERSGGGGGGEGGAPPAPASGGRARARSWIEAAASATSALLRRSPAASMGSDAVAQQHESGDEDEGTVRSSSEARPANETMRHRSARGMF
jgi:hypothetical protein